MEAPAQTIRDTALELRASGISILPIVADGSKAPAVAWDEYKTAIAGETTVNGWFSVPQPRGIAVVGGKVSNCLEILDFDEPGLYEQWIEFVKDAGLSSLIEQLPLEATPKGGRHLFWRCDAYTGNTKIAQRPKPNGKLETLIETRGEGGYAIVSPSPAACHPLNKPYVMLRGAITETPFITPDERDVLLTLARAFNEYVAPERHFPNDAPSTPKDSTFTRPGDDFNARADWREILEPRGWRLLFHQGQKGCWQRPDKDGRGLSATTNYAGGKYGEDRLYVFSSNAYPFEPERSYSKFSAYALLEHNGDFKAAARELAQKGYGTPVIPFIDMQHYYAPHNSSSNGNGHTTIDQETGEITEQVDNVIQFKKEIWPEPIAPEAYHGILGEILSAVMPETEADPAAVLVSLLVGIGNMIGRGTYTMIGPTRHGVNLFAAVVGATGAGRKGTSWDVAREVLLAIDPEWRQRIQAGGLSSGEGVIWSVRDKIEKLTNARDNRNKIIPDQFVTELIDPGIDDKRLMIAETEFGGALRVMARDGNTLSPILRNAWDGNDLSALTKNSPARCTDPHISMVGHITPEELLRCLSESESSNGFANRFLWVCSRLSKYLPEGGNPPVYGDALTRLGDAIQYGKSAGAFKRTKAASAIWEVEYRRLTNAPPGLLGMVTNRAAAQVWRLSVLYAVLDFATTIDVEHQAAALAVWNYCEASARYIFGDATGDAVADKILTHLRSIPEGLNRSEIHHLFGNNAPVRRIEQALQLLKSLNRASETIIKTAGRPIEQWRAV